MFKPSNNAMSTQVILYTSKILKNGEHPIMIRVIKDRKPKYFSIGESCHPSLWDAKNSCPKRGHPQKKELELKIDIKKNEVKKLLLDMENEKKDFSLDEFGQKYKASTKRTTFLSYLNEIIDGLIKEGRIGYATSHKDLRRVILTFRDGRDFQFTDIDQTFLRKFEQDCRIKHFNDNTIGVYFRTLRAIYNKAIKDGYAKKASYPFDDFKVARLKNDTKKRAISKGDVKKIEGLQLVEHSRLFHSQNFFLFSFYCLGINFVDVARLQWSNFKEQDDKVILYYVRSKTSKLFRIQLLPPAIKILNFYKANKTGDYVFPYLDKDIHNNAVSIDNRLKKTKTQTNKDLKELARLAGVDENITTYVPRHSFATTLKRQGVSISKISALMGHDSEKTTNDYLDDFDNEDLYQATLALL